MPARKVAAKKAATRPRKAPPTTARTKPAKKTAAKRTKAEPSAEPQEARIDVDPAMEPGWSDAAEQLFQEMPQRHQWFCLKYLANGFNATQAAKDAGFSAHTADSQASRLLKDVKVAAFMAEWSKAKLDELKVTPERVLEEVAKMAFFDVRQLFTVDGKLIPLRELDDRTAAAIAGLDFKEIKLDEVPIGGLTKIKLVDKGMSLDRLMRYFGMFRDKVEHTGTVGVQLVHSVPRPKREE